MLVWLLALVLQRPVTPGMVITSTQALPPGVHVAASPDAAHPAITIRGSNITVDFSHVTLQGTLTGRDPDTFAGLAVLVDGGENVTIRNLTARGYKIGVLARRTRRLHITEKTVKSHLTRVFREIGVTDRTQAALWAQRHGLGARRGD